MNSKTLIVKILLLVAVSLPFFLFLSTEAKASDADCCTPPDVLLNRNCGIGPCNDVPSGCGCIFWVCDDGSSFQYPPDGCFFIGKNKICALGSSSVCEQTCVQCGNQICGDPPCDPLDTCQSSCASGCPGGSSTSYSGPDCRFSEPHGPCDLGCGLSESCPSTTCYYPETNTTPPTPTSLSLNVGAIRSLLSNNNGLRTLVPSPLSAESTTMSTSQYTGAGEGVSVDYSIKANNQGILGLSLYSGWTNYTDSPLRTEDARYYGPSYSDVPFNPVLTAQNVLVARAIGELRGSVNTNDRCDNDTLTSPERYGYYLVNTIPSVTTISKNFGNPDADPDGISSGCSTSTYTGTEANNPVGFRLTFNDINNSEYYDVEALYVWFANTTNGTTTAPTIEAVSNTGTVGSSSRNSFGFMVRKAGSVWNSVPNAAGLIGNTGGTWGSGSNVYVSSSSGGWRLISTTNGIIKGPSNLNMVRIFDVAVTANGDDLTMSFKAEFYDSEDSGGEAVNDGLYNVIGGASDHFTFLPLGGTTLRTQPNWNRSTQWSIDLTRPEVSINDPYVVSAQYMAFETTATDNFSEVKRVLGSAYRTGEGDIVVNGPINSEYGTQQKIGFLNDLEVPLLPDDYTTGDAFVSFNTAINNYLWIFNDEVSNERIDINIRDNEGGGFLYYSTSFDNACNYSDPDDLDSTNTFGDIGTPWLMTKAGSFFSENGTNIKVKEFEDNPSPDQYNFQRIKNDTYSFFRSQTQMSSEFLSGHSGFLNNIVSSNTDIGLFQLLQYDEDNNQPGYWYPELLEKYQRMKLRGEAGKYGQFTESDNDGTSSTFESFANQDGVKAISTLGSGQSIVLLYEGDLEIKSGLVCDKKTLIMVNGNLTINPDVTITTGASAEGVLNGCLFISSGDIIIAEGDRVSTAPPYPKYDLLEGLFLADDQIIIPEADTDESLPARDGLKIHGNIYGFGSSGDTGIVTQRSLKLVDNLVYPTEAVHYDPRYLEIFKFFFGGINYTYKRETGWKPL